MTTYDPDRTPDAASWLALDEGLRIEIVERYHRAARIPLPSPRMHAVIHVVVENQIAMAIPEVAAAMSRLQRQGQTRHAAIHALGGLVAEQMYEALKQTSANEGRRSLTDQYLDRVRQLDAADISRDF